MTLLALAFKYSSLPLQNAPPPLVSIGGTFTKTWQSADFAEVPARVRAVTVTFSSLQKTYILNNSSGGYREKFWK